MARSGTCAAGLVLASLLASCSSESAGGGECVPGLVEACSCNGPVAGARVCGPDSRYSSCDCAASGGAVPDPTGQADYLLELGARVVGERARGALALRNTGSGRLDFEVGPVAAPFAVEGGGALALAGGEAGELGFTFEASAAGTFSAVATVTSGRGAFRVRLAATAFEPTLACDPVEVDFGLVPRLEETGRVVVCVNTAAHPWGLVPGPITGADADAFGVGPLRDEPLPPGGSWTFPVTAVGRRPGPLLATLPLRAVSGREAGSIALAAQGSAAGLSCAPLALDFGFVRPGASGTRTLVCTNESIDPVRIEALSLDPSSDLRFAWSPDAFPITVPARQGDVVASVAFEVVFTPTPEDLGARKNGRLVIESDDPLGARREVELTGFAGGPAIACTPTSLDFGSVDSDLPATRSFTCTNVGADDPERTDDALVVTGLESTAAEFAAVILEPRPEGYAVGETFTVHVTYAPVNDGSDAGAIRVFTNAGAAPVEVALSAVGVLLGSCDFTVVPPSLQFGLVERNRTATLEFAIRNRLPARPCRVRDLRLAATCDAAFSLPAGGFAEAALPPDGELRVPVTFRPTADGVAACDVLFDISNPDRPHQVVRATGSSHPSCVSVVPGDLDLGAARPGCTTPDAELRIVNGCTSPRQITATANPGASTEFRLRSVPPAGTSLAPGASTVLTLAYRPVDEGVDLGSVLVSVGGADDPLLATFRGRGTLDPDQTDAFVQAPRQVDVLWVVDNPLPPISEMELEYNASAFLAYARQQAIDFHIGVTTASLFPSGPCVGGTEGGENGRLVPVAGGRPRILTPATPNLDAVLAQNLGEGPCVAGRQVLQAAARALSPAMLADCGTGNCGFLRPAAHLAIVAVTAGTDPTPLPAESYRDDFLALKGARNAHLFSFHAIAGDRFGGCNSGVVSADPGGAPVSLAGLTRGGIFRSICTDGWAPLLGELSTAAFGYETCVLLRNAPEDTNGNGAVAEADGELEVRLDGEAIPSANGPGAPVWRYEKDQLAICFERSATPPTGTRIEVDYRAACLAP